MKHGLTIGFEAKRLVKNATGLGNYARTLIQELAMQTDCPQLKLFVPEVGREEWRNEISRLPQVDFVLPSLTNLPFTRSWWRYSGMVDDVVKQGCDLFHGMSGELPRGLKKTGIPAIVTIHDLIFLRHPEFYSPIDAAIYRHKFRIACQEATHFIAISECTKKDLIELGGISPERIDVIYQSCAPRFSAPISTEQCQSVLHKYSLKTGYVLSVGSIEARKNALSLVAALTHCAGMRLVLVGRHTPYTKQLKQKAAAWGVTDRLHLLHNVPSNDLPALYRSASLFAYPSRYEGFGIPIIEALSANLPVVATTGSCLEEAGGEQQIYVAPDDINGLSTAISRLLSSPEERLQRSAAGKQHIQRFFGHQQAIRLLALYKKVAQ